MPAGLPDGLLALAAERWRAAEAWSQADGVSGCGLTVPPLDDGDLEAMLVDELTAPLRLEAWPPPTAPTPIGNGWIHDEVVDDDREVLEAVLGDRTGRGPEAVAAAAQELRLPVTPYRRLDEFASTNDDRHDRPADRHPTPPTGSSPTPEPHAERRGATSRPVIVDLTSHWAGPLATALLARSGATVVKLDPACRPDGFRDRPRLYAHLNGEKEIVDLDLRVDDDRRRFEHLLGRADLLVESFSRRVLPNLGYDRSRLAALRPELGLVRIRAFAADTPERDWLAYGPGVHAASGLAFAADPGGPPRPAPVAYADVVAAVTAFAAAAELLADRQGPPDPTEPRRPPRTTEVSLARSIAPLAANASRAIADCGLDPAEAVRRG
ncbi:MAG: CoA transferase [Actinomycetota bacterium]